MISGIRMAVMAMLSLSRSKDTPANWHRQKPVCNIQIARKKNTMIQVTNVWVQIEGFHLQHLMYSKAFASLYTVSVSSPMMDANNYTIARFCISLLTWCMTWRKIETRTIVEALLLLVACAKMSPTYTIMLPLW